MIADANRQWWTLAGCCLGLFVLMLDSTIVTLALPAIQKDLDASNAALQWVVNVYLLALAVMVVTASRFGDMFGRKRVYVWGLALFGAGAVVSATAGSATMLVAGRVVQGIGGAAVVTLSLAIAADAFTPERRATALGIWAGVSAIALAVGPLLGGVLVDDLSWRWVFWLMLPFVGLGIAITELAASESRDETSGQRIDWAGLVVLSIGVVGVILPLVQGKGWGWTSAATVGLFAVGLAGLAVFWRVEHRSSNPIVDFSLFRNGPYFGASAAAFTLVGCWWIQIFYQPQYLQNILGYSPVEAGLLVLPVTLPMAIISPLAGGLIRHFGARTVMTAGMTLAAVAMLLLTRVDATSGYGTVLPAYLLFGVALGLVYAPMSTAAMTAMPAAKAGIAAGVLAMNRMVAGALGLAMAGALFQHISVDNAPQGLRVAYTDALAGSTWISVAFAVIGTILTWAFVRSIDTKVEEVQLNVEETVTPESIEIDAREHHRIIHRWRTHI